MPGTHPPCAPEYPRRIIELARAGVRLMSVTRSPSAHFGQIGVIKEEGEGLPPIDVTNARRKGSEDQTSQAGKTKAVFSCLWFRRIANTV